MQIGPTQADALYRCFQRQQPRRNEHVMGDGGKRQADQEALQTRKDTVVVCQQGSDREESQCV